MSSDDDSKWTLWMRNGRLATIVWFVVLAINVGFKVAKIEAPSMDQLLTAMTGVWIGNLTVAQQARRDKTKKEGTDDSVDV
jgi:hypothetical protein